MRRITLLSFVFIVTYLFMVSNVDGPLNNQNKKVTGAPGDAGTCASIGCHDGAQNSRFSANSDSVKIIFGNNLTKYKPDSTYTIKVQIGTSNNKGAPGNKAGYGFQATAKKITNAGKDSVGTFIAGDAQQSVIGSYIEHNTLRVGTQTDGHIFTFQWKAPSKTSYKDTVRIYVATNEAYRTSIPDVGTDSIRTKVLVLTCDTTITNPGSSISKSSVEYTKLAFNVINDKLVVPQVLINKEYMIISVGGQVVAKGKADQTIDVATLNQGIYYFHSGNSVSPFYKQ